MTKHEKRGRVLIHIPGAWSYPSKKQVTSTHSVNVCMFYFEILLRPSFGMFYKQQTLLFTHENLTATLRSGNLLWLVVYDASAILDCKYTTFSVNKEY